MSANQSKTFRGALAGAVAATMWAAQMPFDKRVFGCEIDDVEILGKALTSGRAWRVLGWLLHIQNGALFGALYAHLAPRLPVPSRVRGPLVALVENFVSLPALVLSNHLHPAREELPSASMARALVQATWRHLLFGFLLGELELRLNTQHKRRPVVYEHVISSNGHGNLEQASPTV